jgi:hypothetical protein
VGAVFGFLFACGLFALLWKKEVFVDEFSGILKFKYSVAGVTLDEIHRGSFGLSPVGFIGSARWLKAGELRLLKTRRVSWVGSSLYMSVENMTSRLEECNVEFSEKAHKRFFSVYSQFGDISKAEEQVSALLK